MEKLTPLLIYILLINILGFITTGIDKQRAINNKWRISERTFFIIGFIGGGIGVYIGMKCFRHKTRNKMFTLGIPMVIVVNLIAFYGVVEQFKLL